MASLGDVLSGLFGFLGPSGILLTLFLIFVLDAMVIPALPELWFVLTYSFRPASLAPAAWAPLLLLMAVLGEAVGNTSLYLIVKHGLVRPGRMPRIMERAMRRWTEFLVLHDERIILVNRVAPVVPMVGAFIATLGWDIRKSFAYVVIGAAGKYALLLVLVVYVGIAFDPVVARLVTFSLVVVIVAASALGSYVYRRRMRKERKPP